MYKSTNTPFSQNNSLNCGNKITDSSPAKVAEFQNSRLWIQQQILGLDVPMADPKWVDIGQTPEQLVHVQLRRENRRR